LLGVTVLLITCSYKSKEFIRIGYYVNVEYDQPELRDAPPPHPDPTHLMRNILAEKPKVTRFAVEWDQVAAPPAPADLHPPPITHEISQNDMSV
jgi:histone chaperone ASF1